MAEKETVKYVNGLPLIDSRSEKILSKENIIWLVSVLGAASLTIIIPVVHLGGVGWFLWREFDRKVDRSACTCSCWDTVFKGQYERGVSGYKHIYFNVTSNTLKIWILTVSSLVALYECGKKIIVLWWKRQVRLPIFVLFCFGVFPHYYSWWNYFNYLNDEFYSQWYHQIYFSITEIISTVFVVKLLDSKVIPQPNEILVILSVAVFHISASCYDQFLSNVLVGKGKDFQVYRDIGLMIPDLLHFWLPLRELRKLNKPIGSQFTVKNWLAAAGFIVFSWIGVLAF